MLGAEVDGAAQLLAPGGRGLAGAGVDHVDGQARKGPRRRLGRPDRGGRVVVAAEERQGLVLQRLKAQRQAADAGRGEAREPRGLGVGGVGLWVTSRSDAGV